MSTVNSKTASVEVNEEIPTDHTKPHLHVHRDVSYLLAQGKISPTEAILVAIVDSLCGPNGYGCWATNEYLAKLLGGFSKSGVSAMLSKLEKMKLIIQKGWRKTKHGSVRVMETAYSKITKEETIYGEMTRGGSQKYRNKDKEQDDPIIVDNDDPIIVKNNGGFTMNSDHSTYLDGANTKKEEREERSAETTASSTAPRNASRPTAARSSPEPSKPKTNKGGRGTTSEAKQIDMSTINIANMSHQEGAIYFREGLRNKNKHINTYHEKKWVKALQELEEQNNAKDWREVLAFYVKNSAARDISRLKLPDLADTLQFKERFTWVRGKYLKSQSKKQSSGNFHDDDDNQLSEDEIW